MRENKRKAKKDDKIHIFDVILKEHNSILSFFIANVKARIDYKKIINYGKKNKEEQNVDNWYILILRIPSTLSYIII